MEAEVARLQAAAKGEAEGRAEVEAQLRVAGEEITRLKGEREMEAENSATGCGHGEGSGGVHPSPSGGQPLGDEGGRLPLARGTAGGTDAPVSEDDGNDDKDDDGSETSTVAMAEDDCGNAMAEHDCDNAEILDEGNREDDCDKGQSEQQKQRRSGVEVEAEDHKSPEMLPKRRTRRRLGQVLYLVQP